MSDISKAAAALGRKGGAAGTGGAKVRGDADYYRKLVARRKDRKREVETCDSCGERVGYYDPSLPEGEKIVITRECECAREAGAYLKRKP